MKKHSLSLQPVSNLNIESLLDKFQDYQYHYRDISPETVNRYKVYLLRFFDWLKTHAGKVVFNQLPFSVLVRFKDFYYDKHPPGSCHWLARSLRAFLYFCYINSYLEFNLTYIFPTGHGYKRKHVPAVLSDENIDNLIQNFNHKSSGGMRDYAIILLLLYYGVRGIQIRKLRLSNIDWEGSRITFPACKNGSALQLPLAESPGNALADYILKERSSSIHEEVFLCLKKDQPLRNSNILSKTIKKRFKESQVKIPENALEGSHIFRHTFASRLLNADESLKNISELLGHKLYETTMIYTKIDLPNLRKVALEWVEVSYG